MIRVGSTSRGEHRPCASLASRNRGRRVIQEDALKLTSKLLAVALACAASFPALAQQQITGAGSTFVYPILSAWSEAYSQQKGVRVNYQSIGSGGGIAQIKAATVDFGASDAPLAPDQLKAAGLTQFPLVIGGVVPVVNLQGIAPGQMKFTGALLADLYMGKIKKWNDPAVAAVNPGVALPDQNVTIVHRSDGSGTTFNWVNYLSKVSPEWKDKIGEGTSVSWPVGVGGKGNEGVAEYVNRIKGSIGYVEYAYVLQNKMTYGQVQNSSGQFIQPTAASFQAAAASADWSKADNYYLVITNAPGAQSYPISATVFMMMYKQPKDPARSAAAIEFFRWALENGQDQAAKLDYVPLPAPLVQQIEASWKSEIK